MSGTNIVAVVIGLALMAGIAWFFWGPRKSGVRAADHFQRLPGSHDPGQGWLYAGCTHCPARQAGALHLSPGRDGSLLGDGGLQRFWQERPASDGRNGAGRVPAREARRIRVYLPDGHVPGQADCRMRYSFPSGQETPGAGSGQTGTLAGEKRPLALR